MIVDGLGHAWKLHEIAELLMLFHVVSSKLHVVLGVLMFLAEEHTLTDIFSESIGAAQPPDERSLR